MRNKIELINALFNKISYYEEGSSSFSCREFQENFVGLLALFEAEQDQIEDSREVDRILSRRIREFDLNRSDLRRLSLHLLTMYYKFSANVPHPLDRAYILCREKRRPKKDAQYLIEDLVPLVFKPRSLNDEFELKYFFLERIAVFQNKFGGAPPLYDTLSIEEIKMIPKSVLLLGLIRRSIARMGSVQREGTIENKCFRYGYFGTLGGEERFYRFVLQKLGYYVKIPWYSKIWVPVKRGFLRIFSVFFSSNYLIYVLTRRRAAFLLYLFFILFFLAISVAVPLWWKNLNQKKLERLKQAQASETIESFPQIDGGIEYKEFWLC
ncbi:MAG: hypothetical protein ACE5KJ_01010 [Candidatus Zixiibacteriota bacterium]